MARGLNGGKIKGGRKNRKFGRNKTGCEVYRLQGRSEKNKAIRLARHLKAHPKDH